MTERPMPGAGMGGAAGAAVSAWVAACRAWAGGVSRATWLEVAAVVVITASALFLRMYELTTLPDGIHGDEAVAGLEAQRILDDHGIGPYSTKAAGQPAGPLYLVAAAVAVLGHTVLALRIVPALLGTATVPVLYFVLKRAFDRPIGMAGAGFLAVMGWHIHFARVGFPLEAWPLVVVLGVAALAEAARANSGRWWGIAGAAAAAGIYVYNGQVLLLGVVAGAICVWLVTRRGEGLRTSLRGPGVFAGCAAIVVLPMAWYAAQPESSYFHHFHRDAITSAADWHAQDGVVEQVEFLAGRYRHVWARLTINPEVDTVDGTGLTPVIPPLMAVMAAFGMATATWRWRGPFTWLALALVALMPLAPVLTIDGVARRSFAMAPFVAAFCGVAAVEMVRVAARMSVGNTARRIAVGVTAMVVAAASGVVGYQNVEGYFGTFHGDWRQDWVFARQYTDSVSYIAEQSPGAYVYYYSDRWSFDYEPRLFLAQSAQGEDRSQEFASFSLEIPRVDGKERPVMMLLGRYRALLPEIEWMYPGGRVEVRGDAYDPDSVAYWLP